MNQPIDLTKGRLQVSHTCYPDGKVEYHLPMARQLWVKKPMTPREYYENYYKR